MEYLVSYPYVLYDLNRRKLLSQLTKQGPSNVSYFQLNKPYDKVLGAGSVHSKA